MEREVPKLARAALLGPHLVARARHPEPPGRQVGSRRLKWVTHRHHRPALMTCLARQASRTRGRRCPEVPPQLRASRHDAAGHGDEKQDVDSGEPRSAVDVEQRQSVQPGRQVGVLAVEVRHRSRVAGHTPLRQE
jgi:hypothetical protein